MAELSIRYWYCINETCGEVLGSVLGNEVTFSENVLGENISSRGPNIIITCPKCGTKKVWYTSDPLTRAVHNLVDVFATQIAIAANKQVSLAIQETRAKK